MAADVFSKFKKSLEEKFIWEYGSPEQKGSSIIDKDADTQKLKE